MKALKGSVLNINPLLGESGRNRGRAGELGVRSTGHMKHLGPYPLNNGPGTNFKQKCDIRLMFLKDLSACCMENKLEGNKNVIRT